MKVIHLPSSVAGNSWGLSRGERDLGLQSDVLVLYPSRYQYPADRFIFKKPPANALGKLARRLCIPVIVKEIFSIRNKYDVFHFNFGTSLLDLWMLGLPLLDVPLYKDKGKIVVTYNGCDARQKYPTIDRTSFSACQSDRCSKLCNTGMSDRINRKRIAKFDIYADAIFALNPDLLYFLPGRAKYLPYTIPQWSNIKPLPYKVIGKKIKIAHAPTNRVTKGSDIILNALDKVIQKYGGSVEVIIVENQSHANALKMYEEADMVIDQIVVGFYGGFAVEAMKMGKPVMAFIRQEDLRFLPEQMAEECKKTIICADPSSIVEKLCEIIENPEMLKDFREAGLDYVNRWHDPKYVAGITKSVYES